MSLDWDARTYDSVAGPVQGFGRSLLERLELHGDETVLDAGCGSGAVTRELARRVPRGRVVAVDASEAMIERARAELADEPRITVARVDLLELALEDEFDLAFSSAVFHWIPDHERLFARLHAALRPGGRLLAQCGGEGNVADAQQALARVQAEPPFAEHFGGWPGPWNFSPPHVACERLEAAGFEDVRAETHIERVRPQDPGRYLATMIAVGHLDLLAPEFRAEFVARVSDAMEHPEEQRYVRLTLAARRATIGA